MNESERFGEAAQVLADAAQDLATAVENKTISASRVDTERLQQFRREVANWLEIAKGQGPARPSETT